MDDYNGDFDLYWNYESARLAKRGERTSVKILSYVGNDATCMAKSIHGGASQVTSSRGRSGQKMLN